MAAYRGAKSYAPHEEQPKEEDNHHVLSSSGDLFYFYAQTLEQCAKFTTSRPLYDLFMVFKKWLRIYAGEQPLLILQLISNGFLDDVLMAALRRVDIPPRDRKSTDNRFNPADQQTVCRILNTADYCHRTALQVRRIPILWMVFDLLRQLEEKMRDRIDRGFAEKITMQTELELFLGYIALPAPEGLTDWIPSVISVAIAQLLRDLEQCTETYFISMTRILWSSIETVSGQMSYVLELARVVDAFIEGIKGSIEQKKYLRNFYDKASKYGYWCSLGKALIILLSAS